MLILACDTSTSTNSVAVCADAVVLAETIVEAGRRHSERLLDTVAWLVSEAGVTLGELECLAVSVGPGSFTGLRVGVATFKGLAEGLNLPLIGVPTLDAMSLLVAAPHLVVCPVLDARMKEVFATAYAFAGAEREQIVPEQVCSIQTFVQQVRAPALFLGPGAVLYEEQIRAASPEAVFAPRLHGVPRASAVAAEGIARLSQGARADAAAVAPVYLRKSQAELNRAAARKEAR